MRISDWSSDVCASDLLGKQQGEQDHAAFGIDLAVDQFGAEAALERHDRRHRLAGVVAEAFERHQEAAPGPVRVHQVARGARQREPAPREFVPGEQFAGVALARGGDIRMARSEEHTSELQSLMRISYAVFCLKKKTTNTTHV